MTQDFVCLHCVNSEELRTWIRNNEVTEECSFCNPDEAGDDFSVCMPLDEFAELCANHVRERFISAEDAEIYPDSVDGDYPIDNWTTREVVEEVFNAEDMEIKHSEILNAIVDELGDDTWFDPNLFE